MTGRELAGMLRDVDRLRDGAIGRGALAVDALAEDILTAAHGALSLDAVRQVLAEPLQVVDPASLGSLLSALLAGMVTGDLLGRYQVTREARQARVTIPDVTQAFPGQTVVSAPAFASLGQLSVDPLPPEDAIALFQDKVPLTRNAFDQLVEVYRARAFTIAGQQTAQAVSIVQDWLTKVLEEGLTLKDFRDGLAEAAAAGGISAVNPYYAATVFETNVQTAYNAGRYEMYHAEGMAEAFPFFQYHTVGDDRVRRTHAQMDGFIARRDDPVWDLWWPPAGFN